MSETIIPRLISRFGRWPKSRNDARPIHNKLVVTSAVLLATEVYSSELIQLAKRKARKKPAPKASMICWLVSRLKAYRDCQSATGVTRTAANPRRKAAIARDCKP